MTHSDPSNYIEPQFSPTADFHQDQILAGRYRVLSVLGQGGMGIVYRVEQIFVGKELALKTIMKSEQSEFTLRRFQTEARAVFSLNHPNIIAVHDFGLLDEQTPFMAMEIVNGKTLGEIIQERQLSIDEIIPVFIQVCFGLAHAHESGVVHRDIKPNNIMILDGLPWGTEGSIKILDFGIAKLTQHEGGEIQALTRTGEIFGSPFYMSPEQCLGEKIDYRSDIYSLGCVIFEALTSTPPFVGDSAMSTMIMHQSGKIPTLKEASLGREFPPVLEQIVRSMLAKDPDERYQNLGLAAHDLADLRHGGTPKGSVAINVPRPAKPPVDAPDMVHIRKSHFYSILLTTAAVCAILTGTVTQFTHPITPAPVSGEPPASKSFSGFESVPQERELSDAEKFQKDFVEKKRNNSIKFDASDYPTDETLEVLKDYDGVQRLELTDCKVTDAGFKNLKKSKVLNLILFNDKNIKSVNEIASLAYLQQLNLRSTGITNSAMSKLAKLPMLEELDIADCKITEPGLLALTSAPSLLAVQLSKDQISKEALARLRVKMPRCTFPGYFDQCYLVEEVERKKFRDRPGLLDFKFSMASKANPLSRFTSQYLFEMAIRDEQKGRHKEAWEHVTRAAKINEITKDYKHLHTCLEGEVAYLSEHGSRDEAVAIRDRALAMDIDTEMHDEINLLKRISAAVAFAGQAGKLEKIIDYCKTGLKLVDQSLHQNDVFLPIFCEKIGWTYVELNQVQKGAPFLRRNLAYWEKNQNSPPQPIEFDAGAVAYGEPSKSFYARALVELGHAETNTETRIPLYNKALDLLDSLGLPEELNLKEHYCDACDRMANIYDSKSNSAESIKYLKRALSAIKQMKHPDVFNRKKYFTDRIATYSNSAK